jgi:hypothetical protein
VCTEFPVERSNRVVSGAPWLKAKRSEAWAELQFQLGVGRKREKIWSGPIQCRTIILQC